MIEETGIYVFESKNYSGWIFGDEKSKFWTQTLKNGQKNRFFNPIWQNKGHISALANVLTDVNESAYKSYIIFSERCELKKVSYNIQKTKVINRQHLIKTIKKDISNSTKVFTKNEIDKINKTLVEYSLVKDDIKIKHIESIKGK